MHRILSVGIDPNLLTTRQALLALHGYDCVSATPEHVDAMLQASKFDLVILSAMLSPEEKLHIQAKTPAGTRQLVLQTLVWPADLLSLVAKALD
jgi:DNA-binding response OmpR family regulator